MQEQRSSLGNFCGTFEIGSTSSNLPLDEQVFWNNVPHAQMVNQNFPVPPSSSSDTRMSSENVSRQAHSVLDFWNTGGPSSSLHLLNEGGHNDNALDIGWRSSIASTSRRRPSVEENRPEGVRMLTPIDVGIDLNSSHVENDQTFDEIPNLNRSLEYSCYSSGHVGRNTQVPQSELSPQPSDVGFLQPQNISCSWSLDIPSDPSRAIQFFPVNDVSRQTVPSSSHSFSQKRKSVERHPGQSSTSGSRSSHDLNFAGQGNTVALTDMNQIMTSGHAHFDAATRNEECLQRSTRMRVVPACPSESFTSTMWPQGNSIGHPNHLPVTQSDSPPIPSYHSIVSSLRDNTSSPYIESPAPAIGFPSNVHSSLWGGMPSMRVGNSSSLAMEGGRPTTGETNSRTVLRNNHQAVIPPTNTWRVTPNVENWCLTNANIVTSGNAPSPLQTGNSMGVQQLPRVGWTSSQNHRHEVEVTRLPALSSVSGTRRHGLNLGPHAGHFPTSHEIGNNQGGSVSHGHPQPIMRPAHLLGGHRGGVLGIPSPASLAVIRENRRMFSQIRNMLDHVRRGDIFIQDVLYYDQQGFFGAAGVFDRHRDMRLDVDNMSYEELLALEEQIGNVSTGLPDEKIMKCLRQRKYISLMPEPTEDVEPCSICREEYDEGEEVGRLDCGHDFHVACIKQWLAIKNLCPICKTTAYSSKVK